MALTNTQLAESVASGSVVPRGKDSQCPFMEQSLMEWIYIGPVILILFLNTFFLVWIMWVVITKLRSSGRGEHDHQNWKAAKALLVIMPLLGITYIITIIGPPERTPVLHLLFEYFRAVLLSTQGFAVTLPYCFLNTEVRSILGHHWNRWRVNRSVEQSRGQSTRNSISLAGTYGCNSDLTNVSSSRRNSFMRIHAQYLSNNFGSVGKETQLMTSVVVERSGILGTGPPSHRLIPTIQEVDSTSISSRGSRAEFRIRTGSESAPQVTLTWKSRSSEDLKCAEEEKTVTWKSGTMGGEGYSSQQLYLDNGLYHKNEKCPRQMSKSKSGSLVGKHVSVETVNGILPGKYLPQAFTGHLPQREQSSIVASGQIYEKEQLIDSVKEPSNKSQQGQLLKRLSSPTSKIKHLPESMDGPSSKKEQFLETLSEPLSRMAMNLDCVSDLSNEMRQLNENGQEYLNMKKSDSQNGLSHEKIHLIDHDNIPSCQQQSYCESESSCQKKKQSNSESRLSSRKEQYSYNISEHSPKKVQLSKFVHEHSPRNEKLSESVSGLLSRS